MCWEPKDTLSCRKENLTHKPWHVLLPSKSACVLNAATRNGPHRQGILKNLSISLLFLKYTVHYTLYFNHDLLFWIFSFYTPFLITNITSLLPSLSLSLNSLSSNFEKKVWISKVNLRLYVFFLGSTLFCFQCC